MSYDSSEAVGGALLDAGGPAVKFESGPAVAAAELKGIVSAAVNIWAPTGLQLVEVKRLRALDFEIVDLRGSRLGFAGVASIKIDVDAAGYGWFVDETPEDGHEFLLFAGPAQGKMDLLTVVLHEMGHAFGLEHQFCDGLMHSRLTAGSRLSP